jgi:hypothetical protein
MRRGFLVRGRIGEMFRHVALWCCLTIAGFAGAMAAVGVLQLLLIWTGGYDPIRDDLSPLTIEETCRRKCQVIAVSVVLCGAAGLTSLLFRPVQRSSEPAIGG